MKKLALFSLAVFALFLTACASTPRTIPQKRDMNFQHFTFAVIWQPGNCYAKTPFVSPDCKTIRSPRAAINRQWTMHGIWASIPEELSQQGMHLPTWWHYGCYWYKPHHKIPKSFCKNPRLHLKPEVAHALDRVMPGRKTCLDRHEYFKHAICFGFERNAFFTREMKLLKKLNRTSFTAFVRAHRGQNVALANIHKAFQKSFHLKSSDAIELRCSWNPHTKKNNVLTQAWITIKKDRLDQFPASNVFMAGRRGNCATPVYIAQ